MNHAVNPSKHNRRYHPHHYLAQQAIAQIDRLGLCSQDIIVKMGYPPKHTIPACERLRHVLSSRFLGLDGSYIDKYFSAEAFLVTLFSVIDLPDPSFSQAIACIKEDLEKSPYAPSSYLSHRRIPQT